VANPILAPIVAPMAVAPIAPRAFVVIFVLISRTVSKVWISAVCLALSRVRRLFVNIDFTS
jgi:hypothetical protein